MHVCVCVPRKVHMVDTDVPLSFVENVCYTWMLGSECTNVFVCVCVCVCVCVDGSPNKRVVFAARSVVRE